MRFGDTIVLVTACHAASPREGIDFLPLTVDYREYTYASGRIPGGFFKREGKPAEKEVLTSRLIDRPIRPLFPSGWRYETQVIALVLSADDRERFRRARASPAPARRSPSPRFPFAKPIAGVRVGLIDGAYIVNPTFEQRRKSRLDLTVAGTADAIVMVEAGAKGVTEDEMVKALETAHNAIKSLVAGIDDLAKKVNKPKLKVSRRRDRPRLLPRSRSPRHWPAGRRDAHPGQARELRARRRGPRRTSSRRFPESEVQQRADAKQIFKDLKEKVLRDEILEHGNRLDGRKFDEIRPIWIEVGVLPRVHGSTVFTRGETQALVTCTLGTADDQQKIEMVDGEAWKRFMLHYNFPPFSVGEVAFLRGPGRREIGHGALAERALCR